MNAVDVLEVAAKHEILFVTPHRQHGGVHPAVIERLERVLDRVHRVAQRPLEPRILVETKLASGACELAKAVRIRGKACLNGFDVPCRFVVVDGLELSSDRRELAVDLPLELIVARGIFLVGADDEILFGAPRLEQENGRLARESADFTSVFGDRAIMVLRGDADEKECSDDDETDDANGTDRADLVAQAWAAFDAKHL